ncbi:MAG TPA: hypothetical protein VMV10_17475 [Pirellulales bacterium]|nr:hypothetical protein [Pirellulales bacterium]
MPERQIEAAAATELAASRRALVATASFANGNMPQHCGDDSYSYYFVYRAFAPLLARWAAVSESAGGDFALDDALFRARSQFAQTAQISFLPPHRLHISSLAPNIAFPFWEFPDIPQDEVDGELHVNWVRVCERLSLLLTACEFTRESFLRAGVRTPIRVVPVPIRDQYFELAGWQPERRVTLDCPVYLLPPRESHVIEAPPRGFGQRARSAYRNRVRPYLPRGVHRCLAAGRRAVIGVQEPPPPADPFPLPYRPQDGLELSGVVYTSIFNPFDERKNWRDLLAAFLRALGDKEDATLVLKLAVSKRTMLHGLHILFCHYQQLRIKHRAKVALVATYLSDEQMLDLARASAFYSNASFAEGACLPLQDFLAAGRPAIAPNHTAMADYIGADAAFVPDSRCEPTHWPWDAERRPTTSWNRVDRRSLEQQLKSSYEIARGDSRRYRAMAQCGRERMHEWASAERVWPRLAEALELVQRD